mmetsp:Transcript_6492/g.14801  ORF Transcript_6492/g.14801 Transcript_6492/m.14801 type:complete len:240 (+) Transcript_6492:381-1100(+)
MSYSISTSLSDGKSMVAPLARASRLIIVRMPLNSWSGPMRLSSSAVMAHFPSPHGESTLHRTTTLCLATKSAGSMYLHRTLCANAPPDSRSPLACTVNTSRRRGSSRSLTVVVDWRLLPSWGLYIRLTMSRFSRSTSTLAQRWQWSSSLADSRRRPCSLSFWPSWMTFTVLLSGLCSVTANSFRTHRSDSSVGFRIISRTSSKKASGSGQMASNGPEMQLFSPGWPGESASARTVTSLR